MGTDEWIWSRVFIASLYELADLVESSRRVVSATP